ncbi:hypothetical protein EJB05_55678 [Eragrostis curvula]|uniref:Uncharacterized protein n=1 Tax=Eragrostis curvula TaxID=38414 RepID=A0A5J9SJ27_9POAL|nr:hypothetical protein EJB05_55678 [Eragrostis curvula]
MLRGGCRGRKQRRRMSQSSIQIYTVMGPFVASSIDDGALWRQARQLWCRALKFERVVAEGSWWRGNEREVLTANGAPWMWLHW